MAGPTVGEANRPEFLHTSVLAPLSNSVKPPEPAEKNAPRELEIRITARKAYSS